MANDINFLRPKFGTIYEVQKPGFLRMALIFVTSFLVIFMILNFPVLYNKFDVWMNAHTDQDEILETQMLQAKYGPNMVAGAPSIHPLLQSALEDSHIHIPDINVKAPIVSGTSTDPDQILNELESGVVLYPGSAFENQAVILGHSSSLNPLNKYGNVFSSLGDLKVNDVIQVNYGGEEYLYSVSEKKIGSVFTLANSDIQGDLVLSSCWPVGSDRNRILVIAIRL